jgi:hypothetical protein
MNVLKDYNAFIFRGLEVLKIKANAFKVQGTT